MSKEKEKEKRANLLQQKSSFITKILVMVCFVKIILSEKLFEANIEKAIISANIHKTCYGCGDECDSKTMSEFKWKLYCPGCTQVILWEMEGNENE